MFAWIPTARDLRELIPTGTEQPLLQHFNQLNMREQSDVFWRLVKERMSIAVVGGQPWRWRRICFTMKGDRFWLEPGGIDESNWLYYYGGSTAGYRRSWFGGSSSGTRYAIMRSYIFRGAEGLDWNSPFDAEIETRHIRVLHDKRITLNPGNDVGRGMEIKKVHEIDKNFSYGDEEFQGTYTTSPFSSEGKPGMGDYYVVDFFAPFVFDDTSTLTINSVATCYWHER